MIGRFINADTTDVLTINPTTLTDKNLYAYCDNNPVNRIDENGGMWDLAIDLSGGRALFAACVATAKTVGTAVVAFIGSITPVGWAVIGGVTLAAVVAYVAPKVVTKIKETTYVIPQVTTLAKGGKQRIRDSGLTGLSDEEISELVHDKSLSPKVRKRYEKEEKS